MASAGFNREPVSKAGPWTSRTVIERLLRWCSGYTDGRAWNAAGRSKKKVHTRNFVNSPLRFDASTPRRAHYGPMRAPANLGVFSACCRRTQARVPQGGGSLFRPYLLSPVQSRSRSGRMYTVCVRDAKMEILGKGFTP